MLSEETRNKLESINIAEMISAENHETLVDEFLYVAKSFGKCDRLDELSGILREHCKKVGESIEVINQARTEDEEAIGSMIEELGLPFFWNVVEELSRTIGLELMMVDVVLDTVNGEEGAE